MNAVISAIEGAGINSTDIHTTKLSFGPMYKYNNINESSTITGYQASNMVEVTLDGNVTAKVGQVIDATVSTGANQVQSMGYTMSSGLQAQAKQEAIQKAVIDANSTAFSTASAEGLKITGIQSVTVLSTSTPYFNTYPVAAVVSTSPPITPGQTQYSVQVEVTYTVS